MSSSAGIDAAVARIAPEPCTGSSAALYRIVCVAGACGASSTAATCEVRHVRDEVVLDLAHHRLEHVEALALPLGERVPLAHRAEVDALAEVVHLVEVLAPVLVDHRQHHAALDLAEVLGADRRFLRLVELDGVVGEELDEHVAVRAARRAARV